MKVGMLMSENRYMEAQEHLEQQRELWPRAIHLDLMYLNFICVGYFSADFDRSLMIKKMELGKYDGTLPSVFDETFRLFKTQRCDHIDDALMKELFSLIVAIENTPSPANAQFSILKVEYYGMLRDLNGTIDALDEAFFYQKVSVIPFLKAGVLYSAGLLNEANQSIDLAIQIELSKLPILRTNLEQYFAFKDRIQLSDSQD